MAILWAAAESRVLRKKKRWESSAAFIKSFWYMMSGDLKYWQNIHILINNYFVCVICEMYIDMWCCNVRVIRRNSSSCMLTCRQFCAPHRCMLTNCSCKLTLSPESESVLCCSLLFLSVCFIHRVRPHCLLLSVTASLIKSVEHRCTFHCSYITL